MADEILCAIADGIATLTLNRPDKRNAMNSALLDGLRRQFDELEDHRDVRVIVVRVDLQRRQMDFRVVPSKKKKRTSSEPEA